MRSPLPINARTVAFNILNDVDAKPEISLSDIMFELFDKSNLDERDRSLAAEIVYGVLRHRLFLDYVYQPLLKTRSYPPASIQIILRMGIYQLLFLDRVPPHAAVNESVQIISRLYSRKESGFVNAILRKVAAQKIEDVVLPDKKKSFEQYLSVKYSFPLWLVKKIISQCGKSDAEMFFSASNQPAALTMRVNTLKTSIADVANWIRDHHPEVDIETGKYCPEAINIKRLTIKIDWVPLMQGWVYIQDEASQLIAYLAAPKPGMRVVDYCSAPGGKLTHIAAMADNNAELFALDASRERLKLVAENCQRLGIKNVHIGDNAHSLLSELKQNPADIVLVDAPCSGLGILRRHPDLKWKKNERALKKLPAEQSAILGSAASLVAPNGALIYSTCTIMSDENEGVITKFLKMHPDFEIDNPEKILPQTSGDLITSEGYLKISTAKTGMDGFFAARLKRRS